MLKNIQLLMDASVALMNQYTTIAARFPPATTSTTTQSTSTSQTSDDATNSSQNNQQPTTSTADSTSDDTPVKTEPTTSGVEQLDVSDTNSSLIAGSSGENKATIEDLGRDDDDMDPSDPATELRRRRLQKFLNGEQKQ